MLQYFHLHLPTVVPATSITSKPSQAFYPCPLPDWGPSSRFPRQCTEVMKCKVQSGWYMVHAFNGARAFECLDEYQTVLPSSTRPLLRVSQRLPYRARIHVPRLAAPCTACFVLCSTRSSQRIHQPPIVTKLTQDYAAFTSSPRVPMPSQTSQMREGLGWARARARAYY